MARWETVRFVPEIGEAVLQGGRVRVEILDLGLTLDMTSALKAGDPYYEWAIRFRGR